MRRVFVFLCSVLPLVCSAPLYGDNGGYKGFASYVPFKSQSAPSRSFRSDDSIDTSADSHEIVRHHSGSEEDDSSAYRPNTIPKKYDVLDYTPSHQHGYGGNKISEDSPEDDPYHKATLYGQAEGGYKIADTYQNQHIDSLEDEDGGYEEEELSHPQPYEYGYALKDEHGNMQHKHETSDGHGNVKGSYGFTDEHGIYRSVEYVAGKDGFKASIKTNEPGVDSRNPADVYVEAEKPEHR